MSFTSQAYQYYLENNEALHNLVLSVAALAGIISLWIRWWIQNRHATAAESSALISQQAEYWKQLNEYIKQLDKMESEGGNDFSASLQGIFILSRGMKVGSLEQKMLLDRVCAIIKSRSACPKPAVETSGKIEAAASNEEQQNGKKELKEDCEHCRQQQKNRNNAFFAELVKVVAPSTSFAKTQVLKSLCPFCTKLASRFRKLLSVGFFSKVKQKSYRATLQGVSFPEESELSRRNLKAAFLAGATMKNCDLRETNFDNADLRGVDLRGSNLRGASFRNAHMHGVSLAGADCTGANMKGAILRSAKFCSETCEISGKKYEPAVLLNANLSGAVLAGADLNDCELSETDLRQAILVGAKLDVDKLVNKSSNDISNGKDPKKKWHTAEMVLANWESRSDVLVSNISTSKVIKTPEANDAPCEVIRRHYSAELSKKCHGI